MAESQITCPECGTEIPYTPSRSAQVVKCSGCKNELEIEMEPEAAADRVGAGVKSFQRPTLGDDEAGMKSRTHHAELETGGFGNLLFNPVAGQLGAMHSLGPAGCLVVALLILLLYLGFGWFMTFFPVILGNSGINFGDIISEVPVLVHLGVVIRNLLAPFCLFVVLLLLQLVIFRAGTFSHLSLTTMMCFVPFVVGGLAAGTLYFFREPLAEVMAAMAEVATSFGNTEPEATTVNFLQRVIKWAGASFLVMLVIHAVLLLYGSLRYVVGFSHPVAFYATPIAFALFAGLFDSANYFIFEIDDLFDTLSTLEALK